MQSNGGLVDAHHFRGKDALLSGPAGASWSDGRTGRAAGFEQLIGFDMGGTSTDVSHYSGELERTYETEVAGVRVRAPMIHIHTVAAGGGSVLHFDGARMRVGPGSAGADPGPACYGRGGPLAITDCNVVLGKLRPEYLPAVIRSRWRSAALGLRELCDAFEPLGHTDLRCDRHPSPMTAAVASGFLDIAVDNMANAIKKISVQRGHDVTELHAGLLRWRRGQHACLVADRLGIGRCRSTPWPECCPHSGSDWPTCAWSSIMPSRRRSATGVSTQSQRTGQPSRPGPEMGSSSRRSMARRSSWCDESRSATPGPTPRSTSQPAASTSCCSGSKRPIMPVSGLRRENAISSSSRSRSRRSAGRHASSPPRWLPGQTIRSSARTRR